MTTLIAVSVSSVCHLKISKKLKTLLLSLGVFYFRQLQIPTWVKV